MAAAMRNRRNGKKLKSASSKSSSTSPSPPFKERNLISYLPWIFSIALMLLVAVTVTFMYHETYSNKNHQKSKQNKSSASKVLKKSAENSGLYNLRII